MNKKLYLILLCLLIIIIFTTIGIKASNQKLDTSNLTPIGFEGKVFKAPSLKVGLEALPFHVKFPTFYSDSGYKIGSIITEDEYQKIRVKFSLVAIQADKWINMVAANYNYKNIKDSNVTLANNLKAYYFKREDIAALYFKKDDVYYLISYKNNEQSASESKKALINIANSLN